MVLSPPAWRRMAEADIAPAHALSCRVHPGYPEDCSVFAERLRLYPAGCFVLEGADGLAGYALSHPYRVDAAPALNMRLGALPEDCTTYYIHDVALLPGTRRSGTGSRLVALMKDEARAGGFDSLSLVAVNASAPFWRRHGFAVRVVESLREKLASYGADAVYMRANLP